jgi:hypothetical protein
MARSVPGSATLRRTAVVIEAVTVSPIDGATSGARFQIPTAEPITIPQPASSRTAVAGSRRRPASGRRQFERGSD